MANVLPARKRELVLSLLVEGMSVRGVERITGVTKRAVLKLLVDAGRVCAEYQDRMLRDLPCKRIELDEIWAFVYAKEKNVPRAKNAPPEAGDVWTWTAICRDTKLVVSYRVGDRSGATAIELMDDLRQRLANRVQLTSDGHKPYLEAVEGAFGGDVDYAMLIKEYGNADDGDRSAKARYSPGKINGTHVIHVSGRPDPESICTSIAERHNLQMRMSMRRFTRLTNAFSKKVENHAAMVSLHAMHFNFCRTHGTLRVTPAMEAGVINTFLDVSDIVKLIEADEARQPKKRGPYKKRAKAA